MLNRELIKEKVKNRCNELSINVNDIIIDIYCNIFENIINSKQK